MPKNFYLCFELTCPLILTISCKLVETGELATLDKDLLKRIEDIEKLDEDAKQHLFNVIDTYIQNFKTKKAFAK